MTAPSSNRKRRKVNTGADVSEMCESIREMAQARVQKKAYDRCDHFGAVQADMVRSITDPAQQSFVILKLTEAAHNLCYGNDSASASKIAVTKLPLKRNIYTEPPTPQLLHPAVGQTYPAQSTYLDISHHTTTSSQPFNTSAPHAPHPSYASPVGSYTTPHTASAPHAATPVPPSSRLPIFNVPLDYN